MIISLITDRTQNDVEIAKAEIKAVQEGASPSPAYMKGLKGGYTATDLNRVESAVAQISDAFTKACYPVSVETKTNWTPGDIFDTSHLARYLSNVQVLRDMLTVLDTTPYVPDHYSPYPKANDIEKILTDIGRCVDGMSRILRRSGHWSSVAGVNLWASEMRYYLTTETEAVIKLENGSPLDVYELDEAQISDSAGGGDQYLIVQSGVTKTLEVDAWNL